MKSVIYFIVKPKVSRYNNTKKIGDKELILNSEIYTHQNVSREAIVLATPSMIDTEVKVGDEVIVHHLEDITILKVLRKTVLVILVTINILLIQTKYMLTKEMVTGML